MTATTRLAVVVAHPDDETFGCGSILLHAAAAGARTAVVCATRGEAGGVAPGVRVPTAGVAGLREAELRAAARAMERGGRRAARTSPTRAWTGPPRPARCVGRRTPMWWLRCAGPSLASDRTSW